MRCLLYVRLSHLTDASTSPERQRAEGKAWIERHGAELVRVVEELDVSAFSTGIDRPGLVEALDLIETGAADTLVIYRIDRLARSIITFHQVLERVEAAGGRLVSVSEALDFGTPAGRLVASVLASFAQFESETISSRVKASQAHLEANGKWRGGRRPYGWEPVEAGDGKGFILVEKDDEAAHIRTAVDLIIHGTSVSQAVKRIHEAGSRTTTNKVWTRTNFRKVLIGNSTKDLIGEDTFVELQKLLETRGGRQKQARNLGFLPRPTCGSCGGKMIRTLKAGRDIFACQSGNAAEGYCSLNIVADRVEAEVERTVLAELGDRPHIVTGRDWADPWKEKREQLSAALVDLENDRYVHRLFKTEADVARYRAIHDDLASNLEALPPPVLHPSQDTHRSGLTVAEEWEAWGDEAKRDYLTGRTVVTIMPATSTRWDPGRVQVQFIRDEERLFAATGDDDDNDVQLVPVKR